MGTKHARKPAPPSVRIRMVRNYLKTLKKAMDVDNLEKYYAGEGAPPFFEWYPPTTVLEIEKLMFHARQVAWRYKSNVTDFEKWWRKTAGITNEDVTEATKEWVLEYVTEE
jgi:hypothetical protein